MYLYTKLQICTTKTRKIPVLCPPNRWCRNTLGVLSQYRWVPLHRNMDSLNSQRIRSPICHVLVCMLDWKLVNSKELYLVLLFRIRREVPVRVSFCLKWNQNATTFIYWSTMSLYLSLCSMFLSQTRAYTNVVPPVCRQHSHDSQTSRSISTVNKWHLRHTINAVVSDSWSSMASRWD